MIYTEREREIIDMFYLAIAGPAARSSAAPAAAGFGAPPSRRARGGGWKEHCITEICSKPIDKYNILLVIE